MGEKIMQNIQSSDSHTNIHEFSLAGIWGLHLGEYAGSLSTAQDTCVLPGTLDENKKGEYNNAVNPNRLNRKNIYTGSAVYQKNVHIPKEWEGKSITLIMERTKITRVWVNDILQINYNSNNTLAVAQEYCLTNIQFGKENKLTIEVTNDNYPVKDSSHMLTDETVTNWNGILGDFKLKATAPVYIKNVLVYPNVSDKSIIVKILVKKNLVAATSGKFTIEAVSYNHNGTTLKAPVMTAGFNFSESIGEKEFAYTYSMGEEIVLWSEFNPALYRLKIELRASDADCCDIYKTSFGMREFKAAGTQFEINGIKTFMRGEANSAVFPLTGYAYTTKDEWIEFFRKAQALGINFFRFHSWTPPKPAFDAADELGIYMQPELYGFGNTPFNDYYTEETGRILKYLANNPSFVMFACGNELNTDNETARGEANKLRDYFRSIDNTRLYAEGSNNNYWGVSFNRDDDFWTTCKTHRDNSDPYHIRLSFSWYDAKSGGIIESVQPNSNYSYTYALNGYTKPIMSHEVGQYQVLPDFNTEIPKYDEGIFEACNLMYFRDKMEQRGILHLNRAFSLVTARTSAICYKADIETALRTPNFGGYQLLSIQDFPGQGTAHVGILDNFMNEKAGGFTSEQYKNFNDAIVVLGCLPKLTYTNNEQLTANILISNYGIENLENIDGNWELLREDGAVILSGTFNGSNVPQGSVTAITRISAELSAVNTAAKLELHITVPSLGKSNSYSIWVFPKTTDISIPSDIIISTCFDKAAEEALANGGKVLLLPPNSSKAMPKSVSVRWTNDYWSKMFHNYSTDQAYTMGVYINENHAVFSDFPTEFFGDYQWFNLMKNSRAIILDDAPADLAIMAQNIDHMDRCHRLGSLFEAKVDNGYLMVCTFDLTGQMQKYPEVRQLYKSILNYMHSKEFHPIVSVSKEYINEIISGESCEIPNAETTVSYIDPYIGIEPENCENIEGINGGSFLRQQLAVVDISDEVIFRWHNVDFGAEGSSKIIIKGNTKMPFVEVALRYSDNGSLKEFPIKFENGQGDSYELQSAMYYIQEFDAAGIKNIQNIEIAFKKGTKFDFENFIFKRMN